MLGGIGGEFMQGQREPLRGRRLQRNVRPAARDLVAGAVRRQFIRDKGREIGAAPARIGQKCMGPRQRLDATLDRLDVIVDTLGARQPDDGLDHRKRVAGAMVDLAGEQHLALLGFLAVGDVDGNAADAQHLAGTVDSGGRRPYAPAYLPIGPQRAEFGLLRAGAFGHAVGELMQRQPVVGVNEPADSAGGDFETLRPHPEDAVLALVPTPFVGGEIPIPRTHLAGGERQAPTLLALRQPHVRCFELGGALRHVALEFRIQPLELPGLAEQFGEDPDFGAEHFGNDRHRHVIDAAHLVAAQPVDVGQMNGRDEDDRGLAKPRMLADHGGQLETVELRHADVDKHHRGVILEQELQRFARRRGFHQILVELAENDFVSQ